MSEFQPTWESLDAHEVPDWYHDAKLGIFIHWGVYSVPAWAPTDADIGGENASPYAEWYPYYMYVDGSPTQEYHREQHGADVEYEDFIDEFTAENWDPEEWVDLFADVGANYVVLTGEHHDGFPLWGTHYTKHNAVERGPERDLVGDLCRAVRDCGLRFAASYHANFNYYQPGFEGQFGHPDFRGGDVFDDDAGPGPEYVDFMNAKHRELIRKYEPDLLWFDVPKRDADHLEAKELIADYYNAAAEWEKEVVVNDRASVDAVGPTIDIEEDEDGEFHGDFVTPEYTTFDEIHDEKWECCRGIGHSFGYNRAEDEADYLSAGELVRSLVDIVSKNGNLLINVGPRADGTIPEPQREALSGLGTWLDVNGEAVFGSRPWIVAEDDAADADIRYTHRDRDLYATALEWPGEHLDLSVSRYVDLEKAPDAALLTPDGDVTVDARLEEDELGVVLPDRPESEHAYTVRFSGVGNPREH
jgi:alpha-L-fucosidase